jgi:hypothetical protein
VNFLWPLALRLEPWAASRVAKTEILAMTVFMLH